MFNVFYTLYHIHNGNGLHHQMYTKKWADACLSLSLARPPMRLNWTILQCQCMLQSVCQSKRDSALRQILQSSCRSLASMTACLSIGGTEFQHLSNDCLVSLQWKKNNSILSHWSPWTPRLNRFNTLRRYGNVWKEISSVKLEIADCEQTHFRVEHCMLVSEM